MRMKVTFLHVEPLWLLKAADLALSYAKDYGSEGRLRQRQCVIYAVDNTYFAVWGDTKHVRVAQDAE